VSAVTVPVRRHADAPSRPRRDRQRRHLRVVQDAPRRHPALFLALYLALAAGMVLGAVSLNALAAGGAVEARELSRAVVDAERRRGQLIAEVASLEDPSRIRQAAVDVGMIPASQPRYLAPGRILPADLVPTAPSDDTIKPLLSADGR
jgi:hypothetical protein